MNSTKYFKTKELFANLGKLITSSLELHDILDGVMKEVKTFFEPMNWSLMRYDEADSSLFFSIVEGIKYKDVEKIRIKKGEGIAGTVIETGASIFVTDTEKDSRFSDKVDKVTGFKTRSIIAVPIEFRGKLYGVIEIINHNNGDIFIEDEYLILKTVADFTAIAFANHYIHEDAIMRSERDHLTGFYNNTKLGQVISDFTGKKYLHRRKEDNRSGLVVIYLDLDKFKEINDSFGHREGDIAIRRIASQLQKIFRKEDLIFRVGGDEFLVVIDSSTEDDIEGIINRLKENLSGFLYESKDKSYKIQLSYGITAGPAETIKTLIHDADINMYENKKNRHG